MDKLVCSFFDLGTAALSNWGILEAYPSSSCAASLYRVWGPLEASKFPHTRQLCDFCLASL
jgi:hypothetical protein